MNPQVAQQKQEEIFEKCLEIVKKKRVDYSGDQDAFGNFRLSNFWEISPWLGAAIRMMDKISRFKQLAKNYGKGQVTDESIVDTLVDCINYMVIVYLLWEEENEQRT